MYGVCTSYFAAHAIFWTLGIFNSMGLLRVMLGIMPFFAIICARGIYFLTAAFEKFSWSNFLPYLFTIIIIVYAFSGDKFAFNWEKDFQLRADQYLDKEVAVYVKENYPDYKKFQFYYEAPYQSVTLNQNYFDEKQRKRLLGAFDANSFTDSCFIIWDDWYALMEGKVALEKIEQDTKFQKLKEFERKDFWGVTRKKVLFRKI